ncbi:GM23350 [Drosophila sechellia]|uniref:GM23350 n=1 Tax=Drosophila sechellia TaxID=7238 RepID=B4IFC6_DROSE|nr:GM23350 [Drosophila sechellia]
MCQAARRPCDHMPARRLASHIAHPHILPIEGTTQLRPQSPSSVRAVNSSIDRIKLCFCSGATPAFLSGECGAEKSLIRDPCEISEG